MHLELIKKKKSCFTQGMVFNMFRMFSLTSLWGGKIYWDRNINGDKKRTFLK